MSSTDGKKLVNDLYHGAVVAGLSIGYAQLSKMIFKGPTPKLEPNVRDAGMVVANIAVAMATKDFLITKNIIPADVLGEKNIT